MITTNKTQIRNQMNLDPQSMEEFGRLGREKRLQVLKEEQHTNSINSDIVLEYDEGAHGQKAKKKSQAEIILEMFENIELFNDGNHGYIVLPVKEHKEIWNLNESIITDWIHEKYYRNTGGVPNDNSVKSALKVLNARAKFDGEKHTLSYRIAKHDGAIWYDLTNENCHTVKIYDGGFEVAEKTPIIFKRNTSQSSQVVPLKGGNLDMIFKYVNIAPEYRLLFLAYLVSCYIPGIPHPAVIFYGEQGGAKTTTAKVIKTLVDPCGTEVINLAEIDTKNLIQAFQHNLWLGLDNVSKITPKISDLLCGAVTGSGYQKRELYSDDRTVIYNYRNCIAITGISNVAERSDLLDRCILFPINRISDAERKTEADVKEKSEEEIPYILWSIFEILSKAIGKYKNVKLDILSRMADFNVWGVAIAEAIGEGLGKEFQRQYKSNMDRQNLEALVNNPFASTVMAFAHKLYGNTWEGSASKLLEQLRNTALEENIDTKCPEFPKSSNYVTKNLNAIKSNLASFGIQFSHKYDSRKVSHITLFKEPLNTTLPDRSRILRQPVTKAETIPILNFSEGEI